MLIGLLKCCQVTLKDQSVQSRSIDIVNSSEGHIYKTFKSNFGYEMYLSILPPKFRKVFVKF